MRNFSISTLRIGYLGLTIIKFFTGVIYEMGDPTSKLVVKIYPTINNLWSMGEGTEANIALHEGTWYFEGSYWTIISGENGFTGENVYFFIITIWWIITIGLAFVHLRKGWFGKT